MCSRVALAAVLGFAASCGGSVAEMRREGFVSPSSDLQIRWRKKIVDEPMLEYKPQEFASPVVAGDRLFVGASNGVLYALSRQNGALLFRQQLEGGIVGRGVVAADVVYVGTQGGRLYALSGRSGKTLWSYLCKGPIASTPVIAGKLIYFTSGENRIYALDRQTGAFKWQFDRESPDGFTVRGQSSPLYSDGRVFVGFSDGSLVALKAETGEILWTRSLAGDTSRFVDVDATPIVWNDLVVVSGYSTGVHALDPRDGSIKWRYDVEAASTASAIQDRLFVTSSKSGAFALDREGRLLWRQAVSKGGELSTPIVLGRELLFSAADDGVYVADQNSGELRGFLRTARGITSAPSVDGDEAFVLTNAGYVIGFGARGASPGKKLFDTPAMMAD